MDDLLGKIIAGVASSGVPGLMMLFAIKWLQSSNKELLTELNKERDERITLLEAHITECDLDRKDLRNRLIDVLTSPHKAT